MRHGVAGRPVRGHRRARTRGGVLTGRRALRAAARGTVPTEHAEQVALFQWAQHASSAHPVFELLFAIPNAGAGAQRGQAGKMRAEGVKAGVLDVCLPVARRGFHALYLELKRSHGGRLSPAQRSWIERLAREGNCVRVCHGWDEARVVLEWYDAAATEGPSCGDS